MRPACSCPLMEASLKSKPGNWARGRKGECSACLFESAACMMVPHTRPPPLHRREGWQLLFPEPLDEPHQAAMFTSEQCGVVSHFDPKLHGPHVFCCCIAC